MSVEIGLPTQMGTTSTTSMSGRKQASKCLGNSDSADIHGGFSAVMASIGDSSSAIEDADIKKDRRPKSNEATANSTVDNPINPERSNTQGKGVASEMSATDKPLHDRIPTSKVDGKGIESADQDPYVELAIGGDSAQFDAISTPRAETGSLKNFLHLKATDLSKVGNETDVADSLAYAESSGTALNGIQGSPLANAFDLTKAADTSAKSVAINSGLVLPKLSLEMADAKGKVAKDNIVKEPDRVKGCVGTGGIVKNPDEGSFRARIFQEIKLLTQQASLSREVLEVKQYRGVEPELVKYAQTAERILGTLEQRVDASASVTENATSSTIDSATVVAQSESLAAATDLEGRGPYWISSDLKNAKMKIGNEAEGVVEISINLQGNQAQVAFKVDETLTRNALRDSGLELRDMLRSDGIELAGVSIEISGAGVSNGDGGGGREKSRSEHRRSKPLEEVTLSLEDPKLTVQTNGTQKLDLFV